MGVVRVQIQTVEEIYGLVWTAVANKRPIEATYQGLYRLFCPHRLDGIEQDGFAYSATSTAATVPADLNPLVRLPIGVVWHWRNSAG
jgi:hypothetical protein